MALIQNVTNAGGETQVVEMTPEQEAAFLASRLPGPPDEADGYKGLMGRRIKELEDAGDRVGALELRVELLSKGM